MQSAAMRSSLTPDKDRTASASSVRLPPRNCRTVSGSGSELASDSNCTAVAAEASAVAIAAPLPAAPPPRPPTPAVSPAAIAVVASIALPVPGGELLPSSKAGGNGDDGDDE